MGFRRHGGRGAIGRGRRSFGRRSFGRMSSRRRRVSHRTPFSARGGILR